MYFELREYLALTGVDTRGYTDHSLRQGAAQNTHDLGLPRDDIKVLGRWKSDTFRSVPECRSWTTAQTK